MIRILCLADLHQDFFEEVDDGHIAAVREAVTYSAPLDAIVVAGDAHEHTLRRSPYRMLAELFDPDVTKVPCPVIFTLGNHEFIEKHVDRELARMGELYNPCKYDVHCLDVVGKHRLGAWTFVGNVLWYDGSMKAFPDQDMYKWGQSYGSSTIWADRLIRNFRFEHWHEVCLQQIKANLAPDHNILVTHCVPFRELNTHPPLSGFNAYSGVDDIRRSLGPDHPPITAAICGHTHRRSIGEWHGIRCVNPGNDYYLPLQSYVLELEE